MYTIYRNTNIMNIKLIITSPKLTTYKFVDDDNNEIPVTNLDIIKEKLLHEDEFDIDINLDLEKNSIIKMTHSPVRACNHISGILVLMGNKTYGSVNNKKFYRCIPDNKYFPNFLIPYTMKNKFNKNIQNLYITFKFNHWNDKHPVGILNQVIGETADLSAFYEYQLYCKSLNASIQNFHRETSKKLKHKTDREFIKDILEKYPVIKDKTTEDNIFTIDAKTCFDYDDAIQYIEHNDNCKIIRIYITNVSIWMDVLGLWNAFSDRISTIYLPDRKRPMLPTCLSECLCSLVAGHVRFAFTYEFTFDNDGNIINMDYYNSAIKVFKNFEYEEKDLLENKNYLNCMNLLKIVIKKHKFINYIKNSYDVVSFLMILMNYHVSKELIQSKNGIYRTAFIEKKITMPDKLNSEIKNFITMWNNQSGEYLLFDEEKKKGNDWLHLDSYCHVTSPIRRLVDMLNMIIFQNNKKMLTFTNESNIFVERWLDKLDYINKCMKNIRKIQTECSLLSLFSKKNGNNSNNIYNGVIFNRIKRDDGIYIYNVYLNTLKMLTRIKLFDYVENYEERKFELYYFKDENTFRQKIKLQLVDN